MRNAHHRLAAPPGLLYIALKMSGAYFESMGARLEREWGVDRDEERFVDLAHAALVENPPREHLDVPALFDHLLDPHAAASRQLAPLGAFGQPGWTVYYGRGFAIDIYFWTHALSAIHNHPFCGVFTVLEGFSAHARYRFEEQAALGPRLRIGRVTLEGLELVEAGHIERFSLREHPLVHALLHIPVPSVSMVVRTIRTLGYLRYFPPTLAIAMDEPDDVIARPMALLTMLHQSGDPRFADRFARFLEHADLEVTFRALSQQWASLEPEAQERFCGIAAQRHGEPAAALRPALERAIRAQEADALRAQLHDPDHRLIATGLLLAERRDDVLGLLGARFDDPIARLHSFVDEVGLYEPGEGSAVLAHALIDGGKKSGAERALNVAFGANTVNEQRESIDTYLSRSVFTALLE